MAHKMICPIKCSKIAWTFSTIMMPMNWLNPNWPLLSQSDHSNPFKLISKNKIKSKSGIDLTAVYCVIAHCFMAAIEWLMPCPGSHISTPYTALRSCCESWLDSSSRLKCFHTVFLCCGFYLHRTRCVFNVRLRARSVCMCVFLALILFFIFEWAWALWTKEHMCVLRVIHFFLVLLFYFAFAYPCIIFAPNSMGLFLHWLPSYNALSVWTKWINTMPFYDMK